MRLREILGNKKILQSGSVGQGDIFSYEADEFGAKLGAMVFVGAEKMSHFVKQKQLSWV